MKFQVLASGSNGNCTYLEQDGCALLIDAGVSCKRIAEALDRVMTPGAVLSGVLITHEHYDHINGLFVLAKRYGLNVYATEGTCSMIRYADKRAQIGETQYHEIESGKRFFVGPFSILPISTSHDAVDPVCYRIEANNTAVGIVTDTGCVTGEIRKNTADLDAILLESNHDVRMLEAGSYPYALKRRILGRNGHLSNVDASSFLKSIVTPKLRVVLLGHVSEENNLVEIAELEAIEALQEIAPEKKNPELILEVVGRYGPSKIYEW